MVFDKKAAILTLSQPEPSHFQWTEAKSVWTHMEHTGKTNLFSKVGIGVKTIVFTLRKTSEIDLHNAIARNGRQYFITDVNRDDPLLLVVTTADIQPSMYSAYRIDESEGEYKSAVYSQREIRFPACLTEKYLGFKQDDPMARTETTFVLVTPKMILLEVHDIVKQGSPPTEGAVDNRPAYAVKVCHLLDEFKNEYEITRKGDV